MEKSHELNIRNCINYIKETQFNTDESLAFINNFSNYIRLLNLYQDSKLTESRRAKLYGYIATFDMYFTNFFRPKPMKKKTKEQRTLDQNAEFKQMMLNIEEKRKLTSNEKFKKLVANTQKMRAATATPKADFRALLKEKPVIVPEPVIQEVHHPPKSMHEVHPPPAPINQPTAPINQPPTPINQPTEQLVEQNIVNSIEVHTPTNRVIPVHITDEEVKSTTYRKKPHTIKKDLNYVIKNKNRIYNPSTGKLKNLLLYKHRIKQNISKVTYEMIKPLSKNRYVPFYIDNKINYRVLPSSITNEKDRNDLEIIYRLVYNLIYNRDMDDQPSADELQKFVDEMHAYINLYINYPDINPIANIFKIVISKINELLSLYTYHRANKTWS